jgi:hypothetical protein
MNTFDVELWGHGGAGKTVLLTALYQHFPGRHDPRFNNIYASEQFLKQVTELEVRRKTKPTKPRNPRAAPKSGTVAHNSPTNEVELLSFHFEHAPGNVVRIGFTTFAGEELLTNGAVDEEAFYERFKDPTKLLVAVVNPFLADKELAWKTFRNMIATLQHLSKTLSFQDAFYLAARTLLHAEQTGIDEDHSDVARLLADSWNSIKISYDHSVPALDERFVWTQEGKAIPPKSLEEHERVLNDLTDEWVGRALRLNDLLKGCVSRLPNGIVVLTHLDLLDLLPSVTCADLDNVFGQMFKNKHNRLVSQQVKGPFVSSIADGKQIKLYKTSANETTEFFNSVMSLVQSGNWIPVTRRSDGTAGRIRAGEFDASSYIRRAND